MVRRFRARLSCLLTAAVLALGTTAASVGELLHAAGPHDLACAPSLDRGAHDASSHRIEAPDAADASVDHCVGCHLARSSRLAQTATHIGHLGPAPAHRPAAAIGSARAAALDLLPPRSPPRA